MRGVRVHRLVAMAFLPNPDNLPEVNHKDGDKGNNDVSNLEWISRHGNMQHAATLREKADSRSKKVIEIRADGSEVEHRNISAAAKATELTWGTVSHHCNRKPLTKPKRGFARGPQRFKFAPT